jgi:beta-N-acetylhexosaminidase
MHAAGLNWTLAPVVDINLNPKNPVIGRYGRSFSSDPEIVTRHAHAFIRGLRSYNILNCIKHYPGHGSSRKDSHLSAVDVTETSRPAIELFPYNVLIDRNVVDCVMTAHIYDKKVDPNWIVTFSSKAIMGDLREKIGFEGVVISDDLQMKAVTRRHTLAEAAVLSIAAGNDMVTISNNRTKYKRNLARHIHEAIVDAVLDGKISRERIKEASGRVQKMKSRLLSKEKKPAETP